jgi:5-methylthioadenosine/S-adenosylhomocysteine deaminase
VDTTALTGNADMFAIMKLTQGLVNAGAADEFAMTAGQALAFGTIMGARSLAAAQPANVRTVLCGGRFLKRDGALLTLDPAEVGAAARAALAGVRARA